MSQCWERSQYAIAAKGMARGIVGDKMDRTWAETGQ